MLRKQRFIHSVIARTTPSRHPPNCNSPTHHDVSTGSSFIRNVFIQSNRSLTDHSSPFLSGRGAGGRSRLFQTTQIQNVLHMGIHSLYSLRSCFRFVIPLSVKIHELIRLGTLRIPCPAGNHPDGFRRLPAHLPSTPRVVAVEEPPVDRRPRLPVPREGHAKGVDVAGRG